MRKNRNQARLRLVVSNHDSDFEQRSAWSKYSFTADSPRGSLVYPVAKSRTDVGAKSTISPISSNDSPVSFSSITRCDHVLMRPMLRHPVMEMQRQPVEYFRFTEGMARPPELPRFNQVGPRIKWWRVRRKMSVKQLAKLSKIATTTLYDLERGDMQGTTKLHLIAVALGLNPRYLETDKGDPEDLSAPDPSATPVSWPFDIDPTRLHNLNEVELAYAQTSLLKALETIESARPRSRKKTG